MPKVLALGVATQLDFFFADVTGQSPLCILVVTSFRNSCTIVVVHTRVLQNGGILRYRRENLCSRRSTGVGVYLFWFRLRDALSIPTQTHTIRGLFRASQLAVVVACPCSAQCVLIFIFFATRGFLFFLLLSGEISPVGATQKCGPLLLLLSRETGFVCYFFLLLFECIGVCFASVQNVYI